MQRTRGPGFETPRKEDILFRQDQRTRITTFKMFENIRSIYTRPEDQDSDFSNI